MGIFGWNELNDNKVLIGTVTKYECNCGIFGDGDWVLTVAPANGFEGLLVNRKGNRSDINATGVMECEVEPPDNLGGRNAEDSATTDFFLAHLSRQVVTVTGFWVEDKSHHDKTEIHPITSILVDPPVTSNAAKIIEFFVFSDDSANVPAHVPASGTNRIGEFEVLFPPPPTNAHKPTFQVFNELDMSRSKSFTIVPTTTGFALQGRVESGIPGEGKGFYHAFIKLAYA